MAPLNLLRDLKAEAPDADELRRLVALARERLEDAQRVGLSPESQFTLAYGAGHAISLAGLRRCGYRTDKRYLVFQLLPETMGAGPEIWRILDKAHEKRNLVEYEGFTEIEPALIEAVLEAVSWLIEAWTREGDR
jgi:hypothetical protein